MDEDSQNWLYTLALAHAFAIQLCDDTCLPGWFLVRKMHGISGPYLVCILIGMHFLWTSFNHNNHRWRKLLSIGGGGGGGGGGGRGVDFCLEFIGCIECQTRLNCMSAISVQYVCEHDFGRLPRHHVPSALANFGGALACKPPRFRCLWILFTISH